MFDIITIAEMFIYSAFFVRECMFLCSDKKSSVRFADVFTNENISSITVINKEFFAQTVRDNTNIIDRDDNWNLLLYKEAYHIKRLTPFLNNGLKASRELRLFS